MVKILDEEDKRKKTRGGRKSKLCVEYRLLMALEYIREYRTYFNIGQSYGVSESDCLKIINHVGDTLIKHPDFALPAKKEVLNGNIECEILVMNGTQIPIKRPKKTEKILFRKEKKHTTKTQVVVAKGKEARKLHALPLLTLNDMTLEFLKSRKFAYCQLLKS